MSLPATIRTIKSADDPTIAQIIRTVLESYEVTGENSAFADREIDQMSAAYGTLGSNYFVVEEDGIVVGGAGYGPLAGGDGFTCEVRKMYLLPEARGKGYGRALLERVVEEAEGEGYQTCYLETVPAMTAAQSLYESMGFVSLDSPMGSTGHTACQVWYARRLNS